MTLTAEFETSQTTAKDQKIVKGKETDVESPFQVHELFFSRTDERGVIQAFNGVFSRIAEYPDDSLRGAPHKIIRHSHMPKAVFWLIWDTLKSGKPISGYVKNRSKSGKYYWVYAIIAPIPGGYLSVRMKPTSETLGVVSELYAKILRQEREDGASPEESAGNLLHEIQALGFDDYADFQAHALVTEFQARERELGRKPYRGLTRAIRVTEAKKTICDRLTDITTELAQGTIYILNMKLQATKLGKDRAAVDAIANNYDLILADIKTGITRLKSIMAEATGSNFKQAKESQFLLCASSIMSEVVENFAKEDQPMTTEEQSHEAATLKSLHETYVGQSNAAVLKMMDQCRQVTGGMDSLRQTLLGLSAVRVSLRVETRRLGEKARGLDSLISDIDQSHMRVQDHLEQVFDIAIHLQEAIDAA